MRYEKCPGGVNCGDYSCRICYRPVDDNGARAAIAAPIQARIWLNVPYVEKESAKAQGAKWDVAQRRWYAPSKEIETACMRWALPVVTPPAARGVQQSMTLTRTAVVQEIAKPVVQVRKARRTAIVQETAKPANVNVTLPQAWPVRNKTSTGPAQEAGASYEELMAALGASTKPEKEYVTIDTQRTNYA